jgi:hypothetical protein
MPNLMASLHRVQERLVRLQRIAAHCKQFTILFIPKKVLPSLIPEYELNICNQNYNILSKIIISVENYKISCSCSDASIRKNIFPKGIMKLQYYWRFIQYFHIGTTLQRWYLEVGISLYKI